MSLQKIQARLKVPKSQFNAFGKYNYRSCEDILEAVKPLLDEYKYTLRITDEVVQVGNRVYVKATATIYGESIIFEATGWAREPESKKGMDESQITGAASSYARKYALNGLFAIDDAKDADATNEHNGKHEKVVNEAKKVFNITGNPNQKRAALQQILNKCTDDAVQAFKNQYGNLAKVPAESLDDVIAHYTQLAQEKNNGE